MIYHWYRPKERPPAAGGESPRPKIFLWNNFSMLVVVVHSVITFTMQADLTLSFCFLPATPGTSR